MAENKTIAIVINTSWNIYNFRVGLLTALQDMGYRIVAIAPKDNYSQKLQALGFEYHNITINNKGTNPVEDIKLIGSFYILYKKIKPDILLHYTIKPNIYGTIAARLAGIPVISNISGLGTVFLNNGLSSKIAKLLYRVSLVFPKKVFFQNHDDRKLFLRLKLINDKKTAILPGSGINTNKLVPALFPISNIPSHFSFLFIARLVRDKGLIEYVNAARVIQEAHPSVQFSILGDFYPNNPTAITPKEMENWEKEGVVKYLGTSDNVPAIIAESDCVVLPSYREGLSRVLLEAASMAKPIITTNVPGCRDVVDDGVNGFLCDVKNVNSLVIQMENMLNLKQHERIGMGQKGREKIIKEFDESIVISHYKKAIKNILNKK